jgi:hypothetical protein
MTRTIDRCPICHATVAVIDVQHGAARALPCTHRVEVTMWPDRVELQPFTPRHTDRVFPHGQ